MSQIAAVRLARVERGGLVESEHWGLVTVVDSKGELLQAWGDPLATTFLRSSAKPFQAITAVQLGAAERFEWNDRELAVVTASHSGSSEHLQLVEGLLRKASLDVASFRCGPHAPLDARTRDRLAQSSTPPSALHNNCSGKHAGMMSACLAAGWSPAEYESASHPLQIAIRATIARLLGREPSTIPLAVDGCAVPTFSISMREIAYLYALLADADALAEPDAKAARLVRDAMISHPHLVSYRGHLTDQLGGFLGQQIVSKGGAEGVFGFGLPEQKVGIAIKILDGHPRAIPAVAGQVLARYLPNVDWSAIESVINPPLINTRRDPVGRIVSVLGQS